MSIVQWVAHVSRATFWLAFNLAIVTGLYLLSAHLGTQTGEEERNAGLFVRGLASFWLYIAAWSWLVRGVFQRPAKPAEKRKPTGAEAAKGTLGCLANLIPIPFLFVFAGRAADWAWAGIRGDDVHHPARAAADRLLAGSLYALEHIDEWLPWAIGGMVLLSIIRSVIAAVRRQRRSQGADAQRANQAALQKIKTRGQKGTRPSRAAKAPREILAAAGAASAAAIGVAHAGAHGAETPRFTPGSAREDRVLGALTFSSSDGAWWAHRDEGGFPLQMAGGAEGPDPQALDLARQTVQRSFEVLLRASEAARTVAQTRGVGLPRFTIAAAHVGAGSAPDVSLHLRCDADAGHEYVVKSTDKLQTFKVG
jgi:hypothetical protein